MPLMQWLSDRLGLSSRTPGKAARRAPERRVRALRRTVRPCLEHLEERCVPSTLRVNHDFNVHAAADLTAPHGTLAWAVANAQNGDTILLTGDVAKTGITLTQGELILTQQNLTIETAAGQPPVTISGDNLSRVFELAPGAQVTLSNVIITGGNGVANNPAGNAAEDFSGGGILVDSGAALTIVGSSVSGNEAPLFGGGICNLGTLTVTGSTLGALTVPANSVSNDSGYAGGGLYNQGGTVTISGSTVSHNGSTDGGGIYNLSGTLKLSDSTVSGNSATDEGGGIWNGGTLTVVGSTLSGNSAISLIGFSGIGGAIFNSGVLPALGILTPAVVTLSGSTVSGNSARSVGGIDNNGGTLTVSNFSTVAGNSADFGSGADVLNLGVLYLDSSSTIGILDGNPAILI
jgi:hypothetical protein